MRASQVERSHLNLNEVTRKFKEEFQYLERCSVLQAGRDYDPVDLFCLHQVYLPKIKASVNAHFKRLRTAVRRRSSLAPGAPKGRPSENYAIEKCYGTPVSTEVLQFVEAEVEDYWRSRTTRAFPPKSPWEVDPLSTPELRQRRGGVLRALRWEGMKNTERYVVFRRVTRGLMDG